MQRNDISKIELPVDPSQNQAEVALSKEDGDALYLAEKSYAEVVTNRDAIDVEKLRNVFRLFLRVARRGNQYAIARINEIALEELGEAIAKNPLRRPMISIEEILGSIANESIQDPVAAFNLASILRLSGNHNKADEYIHSLVTSRKATFEVNYYHLVEVYEDRYKKITRDYRPGLLNAFFSSLLLTPFLAASSFLSSVAEVTASCVVRGSLWSALTVPLGFIAGLVYGAITGTFAAIHGFVFETGGMSKFQHKIGIHWLRVAASLQHPKGYSLDGTVNLVHSGVKERQQKIAEIINSRPPVVPGNPSLLALHSANGRQATPNPAPLVQYSSKGAPGGPLFGEALDLAMPPRAPASSPDLKQACRNN